MLQIMHYSCLRVFYSILKKCLILKKVDTFISKKMCKSMRKHYERYSEEFKLSVIRDYYSSGLSKNGCVRKYGLSGIK